MHLSYPPCIHHTEGNSKFENLLSSCTLYMNINLTCLLQKLFEQTLVYLPFHGHYMEIKIQINSIIYFPSAARHHDATDAAAEVTNPPATLVVVCG